MKTCATCGNVYEQAFQVITADGESHWFDSFECAIHLLAPRCEHCGCAVVGHGLEGEEGGVFCCSHCQRMGNGLESVTHP